MKTIHLKLLVIRSLVVIVFAFSLASFMRKPGGDSFTIYLNDKLLVQQFVHLKEKTKTISLQQASANDVVKVHYSHCGKMGIARNLFLKDQQNKTLKVWKFEDSNDGDKGAMRFQANEVARLQKASGNKTLSLIYASEQLPEGFVLANISTSGEVEASIK
jgi:hypothetical protein